MFLAFILCVAPLLFLFWPRAQYPWLLAVSIPFYVWVTWLVTRPLSRDAGWEYIDRGIFSILIFLGMAALAGRAAFSGSLWKNHNLGVLNWRPFKVSVGCTLLASAGWLFTSPFAHLVGARFLIVASAIAIPIFAFVQRKFSNRDYQIMSLALTIVAFSGLIAILIWPSIATSAAKRLAKDEEYCILVTDGRGGYREATSLFELSPLTMRSLEFMGRAYGNHGQILFADGKALHWSYRKMKFEGYADSYERRDCRLKQHFVEHLHYF